MNDMVAPFELLLADLFPLSAVRAIEAGGNADALWERLEESGFLEAMVPEAAGGAGLSLAQAFELFVVAGASVLPLPVAATLLVRALLALEGASAPGGPIAIAARVETLAQGGVRAHQVPCGMTAQWIALSQDDGWLLLPVAAARREPSGIHGSLRADFQWDALPAETIRVGTSVDWMAAGAAITAAQLAGAMERVLAMTVAFANDRVQFGKPIGKFQAIQHQLAVVAENVAATRMAAEIGCTAEGCLPEPLRAAAGKARASEAASLAAPLAHAIHGAIGVTAELDLQLFTRRIHEWRADFGSELHWNRELGRAFIADGRGALEFIRTRLIPANEEIPT
jgi:alkylation response protein AidB-like acyl-CoA dehydrogenase